MYPNEKIILVPTDFSHVAECAIHHAGIIAKNNKEEIILLHVLTKDVLNEVAKGKESLLGIKNKLELQAQYFSSKLNLKVKPLLKEGNLFSTIGEIASSIQASLIVMGTHGVKGIQHLTGAYAIKVIANSKVPVIVVQNKLPELEQYLTIVSPIDDSFDTRQKTLQTIAIAKVFNSKVHLFKMSGNEVETENSVQLNLNYVKRFLEDHEVQFTISEQESKNGDFVKDFINYSKKVQADLIIILTTSEKGLKDLVLGPSEQQVINNIEQIPVMCVNPLQTIYKNESFN